MKHVIIGMAGHVDHGKTELVKTLTGVDTDRLAEEKKRGITIDLGFACLDFPDGSCASIVDVPGHERFIKNMLAGAGGVDLAMLVVAADEGFMPQTVEHLDILQLLGVKDGLIVLTKTDLVDEDWLNMLEEDVKSRVKGTFLEDKPILRTSVRTGEGIEALREALHDLTLHAEEKSARTPFRLPIDRVFSVDGFGTIVTGTLIDGHIAVGDEAQLMPLGNQCRVRNLQVHGRDVSAVYAGQRAAVNLAGIKKESISRGDVLCRTDSMQPSLMLDVKLQNLPDSKRIIESGSRLHLYHGAAVRLAKAVLLDRDALRPGESCYAQLRLSEALAARQGDRFVVRFYSPLETVGGGVILDEHPYRHKRNDARVIASLAVRESGSDEAKLVQAVGERGADGMTLADLAACFDEPEEKLVEMLAVLCARGKLVEIAPSRYLTSSTLDRLWTDCETMLTKYHREHPLHAGMRLAEARQRLLRGKARKNADAILACFAREGKLTLTAEHCALADFSVHLTKRQSAIREELLRTCRAALDGILGQLLERLEAGPGGVDAVRGDGVVHAPRAAAGPAGNAAVGREELCHARPRAREPLAVRLGRDAERVGRGPAVHLEHGAQHERAAPLHVQALQHAVHARHLQLALQQAAVRAAGQVGHVALAPRGDVLAVHVEAHGTLGEQALAVGGQVVERDAEHPGGKRALAAEPGKVRARLHQHLLCGVLGVGHGAQHAQRQVEHLVLHACQQLAQGLLVPFERGVDQCVLVGHAVPLSFSSAGWDAGRCAGSRNGRRGRARAL